MPNYRTYNYQYETSPKKLTPEYDIPKNPYAQKKSATLKKKNKKIEENKKDKRQIKSHIKVMMYIGIIFSILLAISYRNSLINESFNRNEKLKNSLAVLQKENEQLQVNIENNLNLSNIEKLAREKLGMQKLDNNQKVYVSLPKKDYVEPAVEEIVIEEKEENWFEKILKFFTLQ